MVGKIKEAFISRFAKKEPEVTFDDEIARFVNEEYEKRRKARMPFELQWRLNAEFLAGNQFLDIDTISEGLQEIPKLYWWQEREVFNQIATIYETRVSQLSRTVPILKVRPASQDEGDIGAARVSSSLLNSAWEDENVDIVWDDLCSITEETGTSLIKTTWNKDKGAVMFKYLEEKEQVENKDSEGDTQQVVQMLDHDQREIEIREGDIDVTVVSPFEFFPDNNHAPSLERCHSVIHAKAFHIKDIEEMYGVQVKPEKVDVISMQQMQSGMGGVGYSVGGYRGKTSQLENYALVKEYYERPSRKYPDGRFIVVTGTKVLHIGELPYKIGEDNRRDFPFSIARSIKKTNQFWGVSVIERLIPVQRRYNALRNRKAEYLNLVSIGQWIVPEGSLVDDVEITHEPGAIYEYRPASGHKPEPVQYPNLPASFENEVATLLSEFTAISGVSELSRYSQAPSGVKSGVALSIANEQDNTRISNTANNLAHCVRIMGQQWLRMYKQFAAEPRLMRISGRERDVEVAYWDASMLKSDDVLIENSSALAETPAQRRQMVFDMLGAGLFAKEEASTITDATRQKIFDMLEYGNWEGSLMEIKRLQEQKAKRENMKMKQGEVVMVNDYDDDELHIEMHNRMRMSAEYDDLLNSENGHMIDGMVKAHIEMHQERINMRYLEQMQQQMAMQQFASGVKH